MRHQRCTGRLIVDHFVELHGCLGAELGAVSTAATLWTVPSPIGGIIELWLVTLRGDCSREVTIQAILWYSAPEGASMRERFHYFAKASAKTVGAPWVFALAVTVIVAWAITGPAFGYSDTW